MTTRSQNKAIGRRALASRRASPRQRTLLNFVVYVRYPNSIKEYAYLCNFPAVQGDIVCGNHGAKCEVIRTAAFDPRATRYVTEAPDEAAIAREARKRELVQLLRGHAKCQRELLEWTALAKNNPAMKKLLTELKGL